MARHSVLEIALSESVAVTTLASLNFPKQLADQKFPGLAHYSYDNSLLHVIEGSSARGLYLKIIAENWVSEMSHAAYLGKELAKADLTLQLGIPFNQYAAQINP